MNNYKTSKDYSQLKALLDAGYEVIIIHPIYGVAKAYKYESPNQCLVKYDFSSFTIFPSRFDRFHKILIDQDIEYIEPTLPAAVPAGRPAYTNLVVELKQYLATTPPEQQQRDWEQIKAELPDAGQVPVIFYGLSGSTSPATPTDNEPQSNQSDLDYLKSEIEKMHSFFLSESAEFPQCGAYQKAEAIADVLALFKTLPQKQLTHSVTKKSDQVIKNDNLEKELQSLLKESGVTTDYVHQDFLRVVASHFAAYGKDQLLKAMKENHVDTI